MSTNEDTTKSQHSDERTVQSSVEHEEHYPPVLEYAPFPALGSLEEITQTLSRTKTDHSTKATDSKEESPEPEFKQEAYHTEGLRNPGWLSVISCFLVNFFVFGTVFSWGNYQKM